MPLTRGPQPLFITESVKLTMCKPGNRSCRFREWCLVQKFAVTKKPLNLQEWFCGLMLCPYTHLHTLQSTLRWQDYSKQRTKVSSVGFFIRPHRSQLWNSTQATYSSVLVFLGSANRCVNGSTNNPSFIFNLSGALLSNRFVSHHLPHAHARNAFLAPVWYPRAVGV